VAICPGLSVLHHNEGGSVRGHIPIILINPKASIIVHKNSLFIKVEQGNKKGKPQGKQPCPACLYIVESSAAAEMPIELLKLHFTDCLVLNFS
jgi:hypothetical protein